MSTNIAQLSVQRTVRVVSLFLLIHMDTTLMIHVLFIDVSYTTVGAFRTMFTHEQYCNYRKTNTAHFSS